MNEDYKLDRRSDTLRDSNGNAGVSEVGVGNANENCANLEVVDVSNSSLELGSGAPDSEVDARFSGNGKSEEATVSSSEEFRVRVCSASDDGRVENDMGSMEFAVKCEMSTVDRSDDPENRFEAQNEQFQDPFDRYHAQQDRQEYMSGKQVDADKHSIFESKSLLSEFDDYVAAERNGGVRAGVSRDLGYGFEVGDMVWGKVKSHPWWPGHIFNEAFASPMVRRTKREGHVLVAFFGDSSYGWFEPDELIPFDPNFAEKSRQTNSRTFLKAVEEAVDEASRRRGLGLACRCRNPNNFRLTNIQGYFSVDVPDYEPGGIYSSTQIRNARDSFRPTDTLDFVKQLALAPNVGEQKSIIFIKNKATVFAYRRAVFEQYDETYAQAFGVHSLGPSHSRANQLNQPVKQPPKAPLSGQLVIAEALGGGKNNMKSMKVKKDRYLFKRRDEPSNSVQLACKEEPSDAAGRYVFQKRVPSLPVVTQISDKQEDIGLINTGGAVSTSDVYARGAMMDQDRPNGIDLASQGIIPDAKSSLEKGKEAFQETTECLEKDSILSKNMGTSDIFGEKTVPIFGDETVQPLAGETYFDIKPEGNVELSRPFEGFHQSDKAFSTTAEGSNNVHQVKDSHTLVHASPAEAKHPKISVDGVVEKGKGHKRSAGDLNSESSGIGEKKKKKKNKEFGPQMTPERLEKHSASVKVGPLSERPTGQNVSIGLATGEDFGADQVQIDVSAINLLPMDGMGEVNLELPQLLGDLQALALDPFHGIERKIPVIVRKFFLRFRSLVYQKSLLLSPPTDNESLEVCVTRPSSSVGASDNLPDDHVRPSSGVKPVKRLVRPDDPTKAGRKRAPSDRQEEIAANRLKKIKDLKAMTAEKKVAIQKTSEARRGEAKEPTASVPSKLAKQDSIRKAEPPAKAVERTILVIKFPPKTSLPSLAELKARFARFGPIDQSGLRVFWTSSTCRVVFLYKSDAQAAYNYAVGNNSLFGNVSVRCYLKDLEDSSAEVPEVAKARGDDSINGTPRVKDPAMIRQISVLGPQPVIQLKSCLKKSSCDEPGQLPGNGGGGSSKGTPRVKFMLGGEENTSRGEQLIVDYRNNFNNASFADGGALSPVAMDFNSKNVQKVISQPPFPVVALPAQFAKTPQLNFHNSEMVPRNSPNFINSSASATTSATAVDISQQMISLLTRCNDVVTNLSGLLGYVPYHPL